MHTHGTRKREERSSSSSGDAVTGGRSCRSTGCGLGVAGASDDDAVSSESMEGLRLDDRAEDVVRRECCSSSRREREEAGEGDCEGLDRPCESGERLVLGVWLRKDLVGEREGRSSRGEWPIKERRESRAEGKKS